MRRAPRIAEVATDEVTYVLGLGSLAAQPNPLQLAGPAAAIWSLIDGERSESDIVEVLLAELEAAEGAPTADELTAHVHAFVDQMVELGLAVR